MLDAAKGTEALQLLQEELASEDAETHTHAMRRLCLVAEAPRTRAVAAFRAAACRRRLCCQ